MMCVKFSHPKYTRDSKAAIDELLLETNYTASKKLYEFLFGTQHTGFTYGVVAVSKFLSCLGEMDIYEMGKIDHDLRFHFPFFVPASPLFATYGMYLKEVGRNTFEHSDEWREA